MAKSCPLAFRQIDGTVARMNAVGVSLMLVMFLFTGFTWLLYLLAADFVFRLYISKVFSPINWISMGVTQFCAWPKVMVDAGAKRLAAHFGLVFVIALIVLSHMGIASAVYAVSAVFLLCTVLEIGFGYCIGCEIYHIFSRLTKSSAV